MSQASPARTPFGQVGDGQVNSRLELVARARWIALDLETTRFSVFTTTSSAGQGRFALCFDNEQPQKSSASRTLLGPAGKSLLERALHSSTPCVWRSDEGAASDWPAFLHRVEPPVPGTDGIAFPVSTSCGQCGLIVFFGRQDRLDDQFLFEIHARCFQLFDAAAILARGQSSRMAIAVRERDCVEWSSHGMTSDEIADKLGLSRHTVNQYLTNTARKLGAVNRVHVVAKALQLGLIN